MSRQIIKNWQVTTARIAMMICQITNRHMKDESLITTTRESISDHNILWCLLKMIVNSRNFL